MKMMKLKIVYELILVFNNLINSEMKFTQVIHIIVFF